MGQFVYDKSKIYGQAIDNAAQLYDAMKANPDAFKHLPRAVGAVKASSKIFPVAIAGGAIIGGLNDDTNVAAGVIKGGALGVLGGVGASVAGGMYIRSNRAIRSELFDAMKVAKKML